MTWFVASLRDDDTHLGEEVTDGTATTRCGRSFRPIPSRYARHAHSRSAGPPVPARCGGNRARPPRTAHRHLRSGHTKEHHDGAAQGDHVLVGETPDPFSHPQPRRSCDLVHHEAAGLA